MEPDEQHGGGERDPGHLEGAAWALLRAGEYWKAFDLVGRLRADDPDEPGLLGLEAVVLLTLADRDGALLRARQALEIDPESRVALRVIGASGLDTAQGRAAVEALRQALAPVPDDPRLLCMLSRALLDVGRDSEAMAAVQAALSSGGDDPYTLAHAGLVELYGGDAHRAEVWLRAALVLSDSDDAELWAAWLSDALRRQGRFAEASEVLIAFGAPDTEQGLRRLGELAEAKVHARMVVPWFAALALLVVGRLTDTGWLEIAGGAVFVGLLVTIAVRSARLPTPERAALRHVEATNPENRLLGQVLVVLLVIVVGFLGAIFLYAWWTDRL